MKFNELIVILKRLYKEYVKKHFKRIILALVLSLIVAGSTSATAWLLDPAVKKIFIDKDKTLAWLIPLFIVLAFSSKGVSLYFARLNIIKVGNRIGAELQKQISNVILLADIETLDNKHSGKYISYITYDCNSVQHLVSTGVLNIMKDSFSLIGLVYLMFYQNWKLACFAIFMMPLAIFFAKNLGKRIGKVQTEAGEISGDLTTFLSEIFKSSKMIRIYQKEEKEKENAENFINKLTDKNIKIASVMIRATPIMETLTGFMIAGFIFYSGKLISAGELEINNFFSFLAAMMLAYQPIRSLATINMSAYQGAAAAKRIFNIIDNPIITKNDENLPNLKITGSSMTAFVGHSGAGKSTIINLLPRFYEPQEGKIFIDEQNIHELTLYSLRKNISLVSQDVILFDDTIKANIAYADPKASQNQIIEACRFAAADEFIDKLPDAYETFIGENGVRLSGGQKQRISIARAILKKSPIILLDEATSSLDAESEQVVQNAIANLTKNKTTLIIAHRLSTIHNADQIFVLKNGSIIDSGNHDSLMISSGEYKSLYEKQLK
jgi:subfamily B ATP-binding cassette protein MsbA